MKISDFSKASGLSKDTIRYYEKIGILKPQKHNHQRVYDNDHLVIADTIVKLKQVGFSLHEIRSLQELARETDPNQRLTEEEIRNMKQIREMFQRKYEEIILQEQIINETKKVLLRADEKLKKLLGNR